MESAISQLLRRDTRRLGTSSLLVLEDLCFQLKIRPCACRNTRGRGFRGLFSLTPRPQNRSDSNQLLRTVLVLTFLRYNLRFMLAHIQGVPKTMDTLVTSR